MCLTVSIFPDMYPWKVVFVRRIEGSWSSNKFTKSMSKGKYTQNRSVDMLAE